MLPLAFRHEFRLNMFIIEPISDAQIGARLVNGYISIVDDGSEWFKVRFLVFLSAWSYDLWFVTIRYFLNAWGCNRISLRCLEPVQRTVYFPDINPARTGYLVRLRIYP